MHINIDVTLKTMALEFLNHTIWFQRPSFYIKNHKSYIDNIYISAFKWLNLIQKKMFFT